MGLKFERSDDLDKLFEEFAVDPDKKRIFKKIKILKNSLNQKTTKRKTSNPKSARLSFCSQ